MPLKTSSTGSWSVLPIYNPDEGIHHLPPEKQEQIVQKCIERAIRDQIELGIDILVDGQVRDDIISLFARKLPGIKGDTLPYRVVSKILPAKEPITLSDYQYAKALTGKKSLKAHITGPMTIARAMRVEPESPYADKNDPKLILDIAQALGQEAGFLVQAGAEIVQIDEPILADGVDLELAYRAMKQIIDKGEIPCPALHACGNVTQILDDVLTHSPVQIVSIAGGWLNREELRHINYKYLADCKKQIGLGCVRVSEHTVESSIIVQHFLNQMVRRLGEEHVWAVTPNCGLRLMPYEIARKKLEVMIEAARKL